MWRSWRAQEKYFQVKSNSILKDYFKIFNQFKHHLYHAMKFIPPGRFRNLPSDSRDEVDLACGRSRNIHWDLEGAKLGIYIRVKEMVIYLKRYRRCFQ